MNSDNSKRQRLEDQSARGGGDNSSSFDGFGVSSSSSAFGATGSDSPFGTSGMASPFGSTTANDNSPFGSSGNDNPFGASNPFGATTSSDSNPFGSASSATDNQEPASGFGTSNPFGASAAAPPTTSTDPFAMGSGFGNDPGPFGAAPTETEEALPPPSHVVPNPFGGMSSNPFGPSGAAASADPFAMGSGFGNDTTSPFGSAGGPTEEAEEAPSHVVPNPFGGMALGQQQEDHIVPESQPQSEQEDPYYSAEGGAHNVVPNPFAAAGPSDDPFAIGNDADAAPGHVVANPFGASAAAAAAAPQDDPFAFGGNNNDDPGHVVANPFGAAPPQEDPFAFGNVNNEDAAPQPAAGGIFAGFGAAVANLNPFGGAAGGNPFGIANFGPFGGGEDEVNQANDAELDLSQHSLGETFLAGHMNRIAQERSMTLTQEEQRWTKELRDAVNASKDITPKLNDMEIAAQAIANDGHVMNALLAIKALQEFRRTYEIDDTPQQGLECLRALFDQQDGMFLEIESNPQTHECSLVVDVREYDPSKALRIVEGKPAGHSWSVLMRGYYYLSRVLTPSLASVRHGVMLIVDCDGVGWNNFNQEVENQSHAELIKHLPLNYNRTMAYSTAMVTSLWWGLTKRLWQDKFVNALETGCRLVDTDPSQPPRRIADMYRQPDLATVTRRMERQIVELLNTRETNEEDFSLESQQQRQAAAAEVSAR